MDETNALDEQQQVNNDLNIGQITPTDPLSLEIPDKDLADIVPERIKASRAFFNDKYKLDSRREKNEKYRFGRQIDDFEKDKDTKKYQSRSADNAIYEIETTLKPLAMSKLPDMIITPGGEGEERKQSASDLTVVVDEVNKKIEQREALGMAFQHLPVYFTAVLKARWDPEKGKHGDYRFDVINPEYIIIDHTATTRNVDDMGFIAQKSPMTVQDLLMKFPNKKDEIFEELGLDSWKAGNKPTWKELATECNPYEVWFDWYKKDTGEMMDREEMASIYEPGVKWQRVSGVLWILGKLILKKMLDPNYDHTGEQKLFAYENPGDESTKVEVNEQQMMMSAMMGLDIPNMAEETVYYNYFNRPHKPYYFFGYEQWGKIAYDETSRIEQNLRNQENLDDQNRTMLDQLKERKKHIWSKDGGLDKAAVQRMDMDDPKIDALVDGDPNRVHKAIDPDRPDVAQFNAKNGTMQRMYAISHSSAVRGDLQSDVATTNQIGREADFTTTDDLVENTINTASQWMAGWQMQFIKLRYTQEHLVEILGAKGDATYIKMRRDMVFDGMEVRIKASSTDKLKAQRNAIETAGLGPPFTNPIDFFKDMDMNDAEGRAERGMMFMADPMGYFTKYILKLEDVPAQAAAITAGLPPDVAGGTGGTPVYAGPPQQPSPQDASNVASAPPITPPQGSPRIL